MLVTTQDIRENDRTTVKLAALNVTITMDDGQKFKIREENGHLRIQTHEGTIRMEPVASNVINIEEVGI